MSAQMVNETNLCVEESWAMRTRNGGGSGWCGTAISKFPVQLGYCVSSGFTNLRSMFDNFVLLVSVLHQIFQAIRGDTKRFCEDLPCLWSAFFGLLKNTCPETVHRRAVSLGGGELLCRQHDQSNEAVISSRWCRCWEEKPELKLCCLGCVFAMWCWESSSDRSHESSLASLYAVDKQSMFHSHKGGWGKNDSLVYLDFGCLWNASLIPHIPVGSAKGCTRFCESSFHLTIHDNRLREGAAELGELFYYLQLLSLDGDVGLNIWFSGRCITSVFFVLMVWPKLS